MIHANVSMDGVPAIRTEKKDAAAWPRSIGQVRDGGAREDQEVVQPQEDATARDAIGRLGGASGR
jgi:hypothetical protein